VWIGLVLFGIFGGVGLIMIPYEYIAEFIYRPKPITPQEFAKRKKILLPMLNQLRKKGKWIEDQKILVANVLGLSGFCKRSQFEKEIRVWEAAILFQKKEYQKL
jgi:hypothetical protein